MIYLNKYDYKGFVMCETNDINLRINWWRVLLCKIN